MPPQQHCFAKYLCSVLIVQVSDKERQLELDSLFKDVASVLSDKCINPDNNKPYTISMLERALKDVHFSVDLHRNAKQQALDVSRQTSHNAMTTSCTSIMPQLFLCIHMGSKGR